MVNQTIVVMTSDRRIWNPTRVALDIARASQQGPVTIDLFTEGPCLETSGMNALLDDLVDKFDIDPSIYTILTSNQISSSQYRQQRKSWGELRYAQQQMRINKKPPPKNFNRRFGLFVSRSNWIRLAIASYLGRYHDDQTLMTYHYDHTNNYFQDNFGLEEFMTRYWQEKDQVVQFVERLPIHRGAHHYPPSMEHTFDLNWAYDEIFCDVICETFFSGRTFMMTEKTMRAIMHRRPFVVQGPKWYLRNLRLLGFRTFDQWWDEGYDEDPADFRYESLRPVLDHIGSQTAAQIEAWYEDMQEVLDHNYKTLSLLSKDKILNTDFYFID
jgi:hypothetical protein